MYITYSSSSKELHLQPLLGRRSWMEPLHSSKIQSFPGGWDRPCVGCGSTLHKAPGCEDIAQVKQLEPGSQKSLLLELEIKPP